MVRGGVGSACNEEEGEGVLVWWTALNAHLGVEGHALVVLPMTRIGLNKLVIEKDGWLGNKIEYLLGIRKVWDLEGIDNEGFGVVYATSKSVGVDLLQLVHITLFSGPIFSRKKGIVLGFPFLTLKKAK